MQAKEPLCDSSPESSPETSKGRPLLMVDIDGVISLFGPPGDRGSEGSFHAIDGIPHFLSFAAATHLLSLAEAYDLVWASGWEEKAEEHLPHLLGLPAGLPFLRFARMTGPPPARAGRSIDGHWKLTAIDAYAGDRPLAWIDDAFDDSCHAWAEGRPAPTLLVQTDPSRGLTSQEASSLEAWAQGPVAGVDTTVTGASSQLIGTVSSSNTASTSSLPPSAST
jgi:hypothetical protein